MFQELKSVVDDLFDSNGNLVHYSNQIWKTLSDALHGKVLPHNLYNSVFQDRHFWKSDLKKLLSKPSIETFSNSESDHNSEVGSTKYTESETDVDSDVSDTKHVYTFDIPCREYIKIKPTQVRYGKKKTLKLTLF